MSPTKAPRPCAEPGCPELVHAARCPEHEARHLRHTRQAYDAQRGTARERGYTHAWDKYRKRFLARNPFCRHCRHEGKSTLADEVDHIIPVEGASDPLFWDRTNHQGLCRSHHAKKTAEERGGPKRERRRKEGATWTFA
jgi:5-methylcytosine-specific restriction enzyme A